MIDPRDFDRLHALMIQAAECEDFDGAEAMRILTEIAPDKADRDPLINALIKQRERREKQKILYERHGPLAASLVDFFDIEQQERP